MLSLTPLPVMADNFLSEDGFSIAEELGPEDRQGDVRAIGTLSYQESLNKKAQDLAQKKNGLVQQADDLVQMMESIPLETKLKAYEDAKKAYEAAAATGTVNQQALGEKNTVMLSAYNAFGEAKKKYDALEARRVALKADYSNLKKGFVELREQYQHLNKATVDIVTNQTAHIGAIDTVSTYQGVSARDIAVHLGEDYSSGVVVNALRAENSLAVNGNGKIMAEEVSSPQIMTKENGKNALGIMAATATGTGGEDVTIGTNNQRFKEVYLKTAESHKDANTAETAGSESSGQLPLIMFKAVHADTLNLNSGGEFSTIYRILDVNAENTEVSNYTELQVLQLHDTKVTGGGFVYYAGKSAEDLTGQIYNYNFATNGTYVLGGDVGYSSESIFVMEKAHQLVAPNLNYRGTLEIAEGASTFYIRENSIGPNGTYATAHSLNIVGEGSRLNRHYEGEHKEGAYRLVITNDPGDISNSVFEVCETKLSYTCSTEYIRTETGEFHVVDHIAARTDDSAEESNNTTEEGTSSKKEDASKSHHRSGFDSFVADAPEIRKPAASSTTTPASKAATGTATARTTATASAPTITPTPATSKREPETTGAPAPSMLAPSMLAPSMLNNAVMSSSRAAARATTTRLDTLRSNQVSAASASDETGVASGDEAYEAYRKGLWARASGSWARQDSQNGIAGYDHYTQSQTLGMDNLIEDDVRIGLALSTSKSKMRGNEADATRADVHSYQVTGYASYEPGVYFVEGQMAYAYNIIDTARTTTSGTYATGKTHAHQYNVTLRAGAPFSFEHGPTLTPHVGLFYSSTHMASYLEKNAGRWNVEVGSDHTHVLEASLGASLAQEHIRANGSILRPEMRAAVLYEFLGDDAATTAKYTDTGATFKAHGIRPAKVGGTVGAGVGYMTEDGRWEVRADYDVEIRSGFVSHNGMLTGRFNF